MMEDKESKSRSKRVMSELTPDLWGDIGKRLTNTIDIQMFRATSKTFRDRLPSPFPSIFPFNVTPLYCVANNPTMKYYVIEHTGYLLKSDLNNNPCLLSFEKKPQSDGRDFFAFRLFSDDHHKRNPWSQQKILETQRPIKIDMQKLPISMIFKAYYLILTTVPINHPVGKSPFAQKVLLLSYLSNNTQYVVDINPESAITEPGVDLVVMALLANGSLAHVTLNDSTGWKSIATSSQFEDIVNYGGRLWGVDANGGAYVMHDYKSMEMSKVAESPMYNINHIGWTYGRTRVVESSGKLYMLYPRSHITNQKIEIMVFELNSEKGSCGMYEWVEVESIGNKAFFVERGFSFSIAGEELSNHIRNNSIYFDAYSFYRSIYPILRFRFLSGILDLDSIGVYCLMDKKFSKISPDECPPIYCKLHH